MSPRFVCMIDHLGACAAEHPSGGHFCNQLRDDHGPECACTCGHFWGFDPALEAAIKAYRAYYSDPEPANPNAPDARPAHIPSRRVALAACLPADSRWRAVAQANRGRP